MLFWGDWTIILLVPVLLLSLYLSFTDSSVGQVPQVTGLENYARLLALEFKVLGPEDGAGQNALSFGYATVREFAFGDTRLVMWGKRQALLDQPVEHATVLRDVVATLSLACARHVAYSKFKLARHDLF